MASSVIKQPQIKTLMKTYPNEYTIPNSGFTPIDDGADLLGKTIIGIVVTYWASSTGAFSLGLGSNNRVYIYGTPNVKAKTLIVRYAYIQPILAEQDMTSTIRNLPSIAEQGTSGIWAYRKWSDGNAECWGRYGKTISGNSTDTTTYIDYPFSFKAPPFAIVSTNAAGANNYLARQLSNGSDASRIRLFFANTYGSAQNINAHIYVIGRWK